MADAPDPSNHLNKVKDQFKKLLADDNFTAIFNLFDEIMTPNTQTESQMVILKGRYQNLKKQIRNGTIGHDPAQITINKIRVALQELVDELEIADVQLEQKLESQDKEKRAVSLSDLERAGLENQAQILQRKLNYFRQQEAILADAAQKFSLQMQIEENEKKLNEIRQKLGF